MNCGAYVEQEQPLCVKCYNSLKFISGDICRKCGRVKQSGHVCRTGESFPDFARSCVQYSSISSKLIKSFKYRGKTNSGMIMASMMSNIIANSPEFDDSEFITYIPFGYFKKYNRFYNHAKLLAEWISEMTGLPVLHDLIRAFPFMLSQSRIPSSLRITGKHMFRKGKGAIETGHLILVDDVLTTGNTASNACRVIRKYNEVEKVSLITFAS